MSKTISFIIANVGEIPEGASKVFRYGVVGGIAYNDGGTIKAYVNSCTHAGGTLEPRGGIFRCCRHFAEFDPKTGDRLSGQAPEGSRLKPIEVITDGDRLVASYEVHDF